MNEADEADVERAVPHARVEVEANVTTKKDPKLDEILVEKSETWCSECGSTEILERRCRACGSRNISRYDRVRIPEAKVARE